jgi:hypothetical protein
MFNSDTSILDNSIDNNINKVTFNNFVVTSEDNKKIFFNEKEINTIYYNNKLQYQKKD